MDRTNLQKRRTQTIKGLLSVCMVCTLLLLTCLAHADTLNLTGLPGSIAGGYYVGAAYGNLNGGPTTGFTCDDFSHTTYVPSSFAVNVSTIPDLQYAAFKGQPDALAKYEEAAWLLGQIQANPTEVGNIQFAVWSLFYPATPNLGTGEQAWLFAASNIDRSTFDFSGIRIYTPSDSTNQEFLSGTVRSVPEPAALLLVGFGLMGIWPVRRLRSK
jgi:hypothetical protein